MTFGATLPIPSVSKYRFSKALIGPMFDVERALCPRGKIYIHETETTSWLCVGMAFRGITVPRFLHNIVCS